MACFVYHMPNVRTVTAAMLRDAGLSHIYDRGQLPAKAEVLGGPGGTNGLCLGDSRQMDRVGYWPNTQTWRQVPKSTAWIGFANDAPPTPRDLEREQMLRGHLVTLGDENQWLIPVARAVSEANGEASPYVALPTATDIDANGEWTVSGIVPKYRRLWDIACSWWDAYYQKAGPEEVLTPAWMLNAAVDIVSANYRVSRVECAMLSLLTVQVAKEMLDALVDIPSWEKIAEKKTQPDTLSTSDGLAD